MTDLERSDFVFTVGVLSVAVVAVAVSLFLIFAFLSPEISIDIPGGGGVRGD